MIIAVSYKDNEIFEHFGHAEMFAVYKTNDDNTELVSKEIVEVKESGHQAVADLMDSLNVDAVIVGSIGVHARAALAAYGIVAFAGFCGNSDDAAELLMRGQLPFLSDEGGCSGACSGCLLPGRTMRRIAYTIADTTAQEITPRIVPSFPIYSSHTAPIA